MDLNEKASRAIRVDVLSTAAFSNGDLQALYDRPSSQTVLSPSAHFDYERKPADRIDDPDIADKISTEAEGVSSGCLKACKV